MQIEHEGQSFPVYAGMLTTGQRQYADQFKEYCFSIYVGDAGKSVAGVVRALDERHGIEIHQNTMYNWKREGNWDVRARELYQLLRPGYVNETLDTIMRGASEGSSVLADMAAGRIPTDFNRAKVIFGLMDRAGLMPHSAVAEHIRMKAGERPQSDVSSLSDAELQELEASYQPDGIHLPSIEVPDAVVVLADAKRERGIHPDTAR